MESSELHADPPPSMEIPLWQPMPIAEEDVAEVVTRVLESAWVADGPDVSLFARDLSQYLRHPYAVPVNSCTSALQLALRLVGAGPGDEVITTPMTCVATNMPILLAGASPVWADIDPGTGNIDPASIIRAITPRTKAIVTVDWAGLPCDYAAIGRIALEHGLRVIEDAALALGAEYHGEKVGHHADYVCFSFQSSKVLSTGDGGALVCRSFDDYERAKRLIWHGIGSERQGEDYDIEEPGYRFLMSDVAAAIGRVQLPHLDAALAIRRRNAGRFTERLACAAGLSTPQIAADAVPAWWVYTLLVDRREAFIEALDRNGIEASVIQRRNDQYTLFAPYRGAELPGVEEFSRRMVCIPCGHWLNDESVSHVIEAIARGW